MKKKLLGILTVVTLCLSLLPQTAEAAEAVPYRAWNGTSVADVTEPCTNYTVVENSDIAVTWSSGWYVVNGAVTIEAPITVSGTVHLILTDGCNLTAERGIVVAGEATEDENPGDAGDAAAAALASAALAEGENTLHIYGQAGDSGVLTATGGDDCAGIGGGLHYAGGSINIHGGTVKATGGSDGAGIGGGDNGAGGSIAIYGGTITAEGNYGAGIGGGAGGAGGSIAIYGGNVTAEGSGGAGIGSGYNGGAVSGGGENSTGGSITVSGGIITAVGGGAAIGAGHGGKDITVSVNHAVISEDGGENYTVYGDATLTDDFTLPVNSTLTVPYRATLTVLDGVTLTNNGTVYRFGTLVGNIAGSGEVYDSIPYIERSWDPAKKTVTVTEGGCKDFTTVTATTTAWSNGWYVVSGNVTIEAPITVSGTAHLILTDGYTLTAKQGITVQGENALHIYGQTGGSGVLIATGSTGAAGIGGDAHGAGGSITIHGGNVTATGGYFGAGIGGGSDGAGGSITVYSGIVEAEGVGGAGIGGGSDGAGIGGAGGSITIYGGNVTAKGNDGGAGIGGGYGGAGGNITIKGGANVIAISSGAGGAGIGGGYGGAGGSITISGGNVTATGGSDGAGIGGGSGGDGGTIVITGGSVKATPGDGANEAIGAGHGGAAGTLTNEAGQAVQLVTLKESLFWEDGIVAVSILAGTGENLYTYMYNGIGHGGDNSLGEQNLYFYLPAGYPVIVKENGGYRLLKNGIDGAAKCFAALYDGEGKMLRMEALTLAENGVLLPSDSEAAKISVLCLNDSYVPLGGKGTVIL